MSTAVAPANESKGELVIKASFDPRVSAFGQLFKSANFRQSLLSTLPKSITPDRLIRVALSSMTQNPEILECTPESIVLSMLRAASMGLEPDGGPLGQGYLVPFNNKVKVGGREVWQKTCTFIAGYRGLVKLARNSGEVEDVWAEPVRSTDSFRYSLGLSPDLKHERNDADTSGEFKYVYAVALFRSGHKKFVVLNTAEVEQIRAVSKSGDSKYSPWASWTGEMWKKTAVRRLCKLLPLSVEVVEQLAAEDLPDNSLGNALGQSMTLEAPSSLMVPQIPAPAEGVGPADPMADEPSESGPWSRYLAGLQQCATHAECDGLYDLEFGPASTGGYTTEQRQEAPKKRDERKAAIKK